MKQRILVTGGNGFIGTHLCKYLSANGHDFYATTQNITDYFLPERLILANLLDKDKLREILLNFQPNIIVHLAAIASPVYGNVLDVYKINVCGTENLLELSTECLPTHTKLIVTSTAGIYGVQSTPYLHEDLSFNPINHYSYSKMITEIMCRQYQNNLDIQIVRPFNIIGKGQSQSFLIPKLIEAFETKAEKITLGNIGAVRDYIDIDFCVKVIYKLAISKSLLMPAVNICSGRGYSCLDVIHILEELTDHHPNIETSERFIRKNEIWSLVGDCTKLDSVTNRNCLPKPLKEILQCLLEGEDKQ